MRKTVGCAVLAMALCGAAEADTLTKEQARAFVAKEIDLVSKNYVFPEKRAAIIAAIKRHEAAGEYDLTNPADLADKLGGDVIAASNDKHMWIQYDPKEYAAMTASMNAPQGGAPTHGADYFQRAIERQNYGYESLRILPGNVRYVNLTTFNWESARTPQAVTDAARFLGGGDAAIIDLRQNGGGSGQAVRAMISYFMPAKKQELMAYHDGTSGKTDYSFVDLKLAAPRMVGKPLYVLISGSTGSAAEEFAYHIAKFKLGTLVGEHTAGAANNDSVEAVAPGFVVSISTGRAIHPVSNDNWEGVGVQPDVKIDSSKALEQAHLLALQGLAKAHPTDAKDYEWAMQDLQARITPPAKLDTAAQTAYAGDYGVRHVMLENGDLIFQRDGRAKKPMLLIGTDLFSIDDETHVAFQRTDGKVTGFVMTTSAGDSIPAQRTN
ncbi:MAG TPA: S41 family peptidase [Rhizomicrobium sp.]|jgi:hypothetical protein|nr:S41 family peptidase [Rhizomicrobium sp.]